MADVVRAVVQTRPRQLEMREFPRPVIGPEDGALLRVEACGICGTDVEQYRGAMGTRSLPMVPRHEPFGIIEEISPMTAERWGVQAGDRVGVEFLIPCRFCDQCLAGRYLLCKRPVDSYGGYVPSKRGLGLSGGYSESMNLHPNSIVHQIRLIESGKLPLERMQTHRFGLDDVEHAIKLFAGEVPGQDSIHIAIMPGLYGADHADYGQARSTPTSPRPPSPTTAAMTSTASMP